MSDNHGGLYNLINTHEKRIAELKTELAALKEELVGYKYPLRTKETVSVQVEVWDAREAKLTALREAVQEFFNKEMRGAAEAYAAKDRLRRMVLQGEGDE